MSRLSIAILTLLHSVSVASSPAWSRTTEQRRIILFGARWCAPCMGEYRELPELAKAAAPDRLALAWIDRPIPAPAVIGQDVETVPLEEARRLAANIGGDGFGLPFSAMLDAKGRLCAVWRKPLRPTDLSSLHQQCDAGSSGTASTS